MLAGFDLRPGVDKAIGYTTSILFLLTINVRIVYSLKITYFRK